MSVCRTATRRRRQMRQDRKSRRAKMSAIKRYDEAKRGVSSGKKR